VLFPGAGTLRVFEDAEQEALRGVAQRASTSGTARRTPRTAPVAFPRAPARCGKNGKEGVGEWRGMGTGAGVGGASRAAASERAGWRRRRWRVRRLID
jgi:hypothetical protein